jgi:transcriptional antiterminator NusG
MKAMEFSDQEEQFANSDQTPESGEIESPQAEAGSSDPEAESSGEDLESPETEEAGQADSDLPAAETGAPSEADEQPALQDAAEVEPDEAPLQVSDDEEDEQQDEESPAGDAKSDTGLPQSASEPEDESLELDLSFLDGDQAEAEEEEQDDRSWYVVHCYSGYENKVRHNLEQRIETMGMKDMIFDIVVPTEEEIEVKEGKRRTVERRVFPGYILVNMIMTEESWYVVRNTPGVTGFVGMGNQPTPLRPEEVSQIIKRMEAEAPRIKVTFKSGERVRIVDGPFNDFRGTVSEIDMERAKVRVMVNFFGRETPVELDFLQVEKT